LWEERYVVLKPVSPVNALTFLIEVNGLQAGLSREKLSGVQESDGGGMDAGLLKNRMCI